MTDSVCKLLGENLALNAKFDSILNDIREEESKHDTEWKKIELMQQALTEICYNIRKNKEIMDMVKSPASREGTSETGIAR